MERFQAPPPRHTIQTQTAPAVTAADEVVQANPLLRIRGWVWDTGVLGLAFGVPMSMLFAADTAAGLGEVALALLMVPAVCVAMGALSGLLGGVALRVLRARVPAALGLLLATLAANLPWLYLTVTEAGSLATVMTWLPLWILAVTVSIPVSAVRRSRGASASRWNLAAGLLVGVLAVAARLLAAQLGVL